MRADLRARTLMTLLIPVIAVSYSVIFLSGVWDALLILIPLMVGYVPGYMVSRFFDLKGLDLIELTAVRVAISAAVSIVLYVTLSFLGMGDVRYTGLACSTLAMLLLPLQVLIRADSISVQGTLRPNVTFVKMPKQQKVLAIACVGIMIAASIGASYLLLTKEESGFTEFYLLDEEGSVDDIPLEYTVGEAQNIIMGIVNHEGRTVNYTVEVWLLDYTNDNMSITINKMYFYDQFSVVLDNIEVDLEDDWVLQWEAYFELDFEISGVYYLYFMLFKDGVDVPLSETMDTTTDYSDTYIASWRVYACVNEELQYLRMPVIISA